MKGGGILVDLAVPAFFIGTREAFKKYVMKNKKSSKKKI